MPMRRPGLTVGIPVYQDSILARYAVESVLPVADEILVYRDGPQQDAYWPRFLALVGHLPKVRILEGRRQLGYLCKNEFIREASHTLLHFLDSDEILNEHYLDQYTELLRETERQRCVTCLRIQELQGDTTHTPCEGSQLYDTSHSVACLVDGLRWEQEITAENPNGYEGIAGAPIRLFPGGVEVPNSWSLDYDDRADGLGEPLIVHLAGAKENRLLSGRSLAYDYQHERPDCTLEEYVLRQASGPAESPAEVHERLACEWLNSWGAAQPLTPAHGRLPKVLQTLRDVVVCVWEDGVIRRRDDAGWNPELH